MLRRNLWRLLPLAPRDVDRPAAYGKNDDTHLNEQRPDSGPTGSRPRARAAEPYLMPNPIPKPTYALEKKHFLTLYDIYSQIDPTLEVKAFIADKSMYSFDMLVLMEKENANNEYIGWLNQEVKNYLANNAALKEAKLKALIEFFDKREIHVGYGIKGVEPGMINEEPDWAQRELLRSSLNYDWTKWELSWSHWFREVVDHLCSWSDYALDTPDLHIHRHYWAAQAFWARKRVFTDGPELYHFVCDNHVLTLHESLPHPILRFEDMHTVDFAVFMKDVIKAPENIFQMKQDTTMLTESELEYLKSLDTKTMAEYAQRQEAQKQLQEDIKSGKRSAGWLFEPLP